ncbi:PP2C family protein-serine/threonine phosphatase [Paenibacillus thermoaerophilus]|uniref:PP2C family protein-serine/threonine phosphatase n=1 Tax=Paenibacillus thermoaerophilus TaxID=1215385 RepID=A0ABW2V5G4_9BACL|nr:SpoIIE family protein phosphatase [Paenibacillus thermoaerophilus]TMV13903.1 HAMP domain-containing protein [Paenibacillus thermoaerophilus]
MAGQVETGPLLWRLFAAYAAALGAGSLFLFLNNQLIHGIPPTVQLRFHVPFVLISDAVMAAVLLGMTWARLRIALRESRSVSPGIRAGAFRRLARFPAELFAGMTLLSALFILLFHLAEFRRDNDLTPGGGWGTLIGTILSELSLALMIAVLLYSVARRLLRPFLERTALTETAFAAGRVSLPKQLSAAFSVCYLIAFAASYRYVVAAGSSGSFNPSGLLLLMSAYTLFAGGIFVLFALGIRGELRRLIEALDRLSQAPGDAVQKPIRLASLDEIGRLAESFNVVQRRVVGTYEEVARQLMLAREVQQRLLPGRIPELAHVEFAASCEQCQEVGGDFYEAVRLDERRSAVMIGDVSGKGMSAALLMSAVMTGVRLELPDIRCAGELLTRLNGHVWRAAQGTRYVTMGVALLEAEDGEVRLEYASAGHLSPYLVRGGTAVELPCSSLPLGIDPDRTYGSISCRMRPGESLVLYTDGAVENPDCGGEMPGFERWEEHMARLRTDLPASAQLSLLLEKLCAENQALRDDRTVVLVRCLRPLAAEGGKHAGIA